jgi:hypothetical protein
MLKVRSRIAGFNPSTAVWTQHAKPAIWHAQIWNLLTQTIPGVFQKLALVAAIELFGSWGFKFPTPQWRILVISVISLGYFLEYLWYQLIYIYIYINWYQLISHDPLKYPTILTLSLSQDPPIRSSDPFHRGLDVGGPAKCWPCKKVRWCHGDAKVTGISRGKVLIVSQSHQSCEWVMSCKCCKCCDPSGNKKS